METESVPTEHKLEVLPEEIEEQSQGKIKSLFRKLENSLIQEIKQRLDGVNSSLAQVEQTLDKKYGGMYRTLIHEFLTKQEQKIYNTELSVQATREILADFMYVETKSTDTKEQFLKSFNESFELKLNEIDKRVQAMEASKDDKEEGKDSNG